MKSIKFFIAIIFSWCMVANLNAQTKSTLIYNGSAAQKFDIVFMGDGFTAAQQGDFNTRVANYVEAMFTHNNGGLDNVLSELKDAMNVYRVNKNSSGSGVDRYECNDKASCNMTARNRNTAYDFRYSGCWDCCWMQKGPQSDNKINNALAAVGLAGADYVVMILNETGFGGCSYGRVLSITKTTSNNVLMHELGHSVGGLADEYDRDGCHAGANPSNRNVDKSTNPNKWKLFKRNSITTGSPSEYNVGAFEGARYKENCIYRPTNNSTMRGNTNLFNPPSYDEFWQRNKARSRYNFNKVYSGNFGGNSNADVVLHYGNHLAVYEVGTPDGFTGSGTASRVKSSKWVGKKIPGPGGTWYVNETDKYYVGDFTGDGKDDLLAFFPHNTYPRLGILKSTSTGFQCVKKFYTSINGWQMKSGDRYLVANINGDNKDDFYVINTNNWNQGYTGMFHSTGNNFSYRKRYDKFLPGHFMSNSDKYFVADFTGDNKDDLVLFNTSSKVTRMFRSNSNSLTIVKEYFAALPNWSSKAGDKYYIADFNNDGKDDVYIFNGTNWNKPYLLMLRSTGAGYSYVKRYDGSIPGWQMKKNDKFYVADHSGDGKEDLFVYNATDWPGREYLGRLTSGTNKLTGAWQEDWIGGWNLGTVDKFTVADKAAGRDHLFVHNTNWFGYMIPGNNGMYVRSMYKDYIHAFKHHDYGWY